MSECRYFGFLLPYLIFFPAAFFPGSLPAELLTEVPEKIEDRLPEEVVRALGKTATLRATFRRLGRDTGKLAPGYPWVVSTDQAEVRLNESAYLRSLKALSGLSPESPLRARGKWAILIDREEFEGAEELGSGGRYFKSCLVAEEIFPDAQKGPTPPVPSGRPRAEIEKEIKEERLKEARDPRRASSSRRQLARLYAEAGDYEKAIAEYRFEMILDPSRASDFHDKIAEVYRMAGDEGRAGIEEELAELTQKKSSAAKYRDRLQAWKNQGKYELVLQEYLFLLQTDPDSRAVYLKEIARLYGRLGDEERSRLHYRKLIDLYRDRIEEKPHRAYDYHLRLAELFEEMGNVEDARREYERAGELKRGDLPRALAEQAELIENQGRFDEAWELYLKAEAASGEDAASLQMKMADFLKNRGKTAEAFSYLEKAARSGGKEGARARLKIARLYFSSNEPEKALIAYEEALPLLSISSQAAVHEDRGDILLELKREEEAKESFRMALRLLQAAQGDETPDERLLEKMARLAEKAGDEEKLAFCRQELVVVYHDSLTESPDRSRSYLQKLAELYRVLGRFDDAAAQYLDWSRLEPENPSPHYRLYRLYRDDLKDEKRAELARRKYEELKISTKSKF